MPPEETQPECVWPPLAEPYATALRQAVAYILGRWHPLGIVAAATICRFWLAPASQPPEPQ